MKSKTTIILVFYILTCFSQNIQVTYTHSFNYKLVNKNKKTIASESQKIMDKKSRKLKKNLVFNKEEAYYAPLPLLESDLNSKDLKTVMSLFKFKGCYYFDNSKKKVLYPETLTGEDYIVTYDYLKDWKITKNTKEILGYTCYKATITVKDHEGQGKYSLLDYEAWFTPKLPYSYGPKGVSGLPGLILELTDRKYFTHKAEKIIFDKPTLEIKKPKGVAVTDLEYGEIFFKLSQEAMKYRGKSRRR